MTSNMLVIKQENDVVAAADTGDPFEWPGEGKNSHPTKMPTQDPRSSKPRNPKRRQDGGKKKAGYSHARLKHKHDHREKEREAKANANAVLLSGAGPNWTRSHLKKVAKFAKDAKRRHDHHNKLRKALLEVFAKRDFKAEEAHEPDEYDLLFKEVQDEIAAEQKLKIEQVEDDNVTIKAEADEKSEYEGDRVKLDARP